MEEKIKEILRIRISGFQMVDDSDPIEIAGVDVSAREIADHFREFMEWTKNYCTSMFKDFKDGMMWALIEDLHPWDNEPNKWYTSEEIYNYWLTNIKDK